MPARRRRRRLHALHGNHVGQFEKGHPHFVQDRLQHAILGVGQVAFGLFGKDSHQVDRLFRAEDIEFVITLIFTGVRSKLLAPSRTARLLIGKTDFGKIVTVLQRKIELALIELTAIDRSMFIAQNEAYLASLFPNGAKPNGNGEHDAETEGEGD